MRVWFTLRARADLEAIFSYLDTRNPTAARTVKREIERAAAALSLAPYLGVVSNRSLEFRSLRAGRYPYRLTTGSGATRYGSSTSATPRVAHGKENGIDGQ
jgi:plasmid stabilization system protein ParE